MANIEMSQRTRVCKNCEQEFRYAAGPGMDRIHCSAACRKAYQRSRRIPKSEWRRCSNDGCDRTARTRTASKCNSCYLVEQKRRAGRCSVRKCERPAIRVGHILCEVHYSRVRRTGRLDLTPRINLQTSGGYWMVKAEGHPLAQASNGWAFTHRIVAYEKYGAGPHPCHWCGKMLEWKKIVVDHLNEKKDDNSPSNLVVACTRCNRIRGAMIPFIREMQPHRIADLIKTFGYMRAGHEAEAA